ncbi:hypothetical protein G4B88_027386 [Cannabis sativa]|uniref:Cytochrome b/b6 N-terminal region profile domain-containing protein n=1 Tax=Cannabis sativa TaxID=3483 RepID=A0A7J6HQV6_CANSA|nr:hypothetical protein G4B88_027386 [Cannabis sativa]
MRLFLELGLNKSVASVGQSTLTRFYSLHTFVLPLLTAVFMLMHFLMIRKQDSIMSCMNRLRKIQSKE